MRLWHFSEDASLQTFVPRDGEVWAVDSTGDDDVERWLDGDRARRVAVIEHDWLLRVRAVRLYAYRVPAEPFDEVNDDRFYTASSTVEAIERVEVGDLLFPLWDRVIETTLDFSGIRLRNAVRA